jgi:group II intron reverse transcriptase/maturase
MTLLQQVLRLDNLRLAWEEVANNNGIPGVDEITIRVWRRNWEERLINLSRAVYTNTYRPQKLRLRRIPKKIAGEFRCLRIPTISDRVLQRAVSQVLMNFYECIFLDCSYGYRPNRGLNNALQHTLVCRENGFRWLLDADIDACFDSIDHELLLRFLQTDLPDESLLPLINAWLEIVRPASAKSRGVPQGSPLSPLLANVFLHRFDLAMRRKGFELVRYADDFIVLASDQAQANSAYQAADNALKNLSLKLELKKTRITNFEEGFTFLGIYFWEDTFSYTWENKEITVKGDANDWLFGKYGPTY